jgi:hypothetical protein
MNMGLTPKQEAEKFLAEVPQEHVFWCHDGRTFRDMKELGKALATMPDEIFAYHVNEEKNDFSNWVIDVIGDVKLAKNLQRAPNREQAAMQVATRVGVLAKRLA